MGMVDYGYYLNTFGGSLIPKEEFKRVMEEAGAIVSALLYPMFADNLSPKQESAWRRALCYEAEYLYDGRMNGTACVKSEKIGDYTVEYRSHAEKQVPSVNGREISPTAVSLLYGAGLMLRWV